MTAKTQAKNVSRTNRKATPPLAPMVLVAAKFDVKPIHALIVADLKAVNGSHKAAGAEYAAFVAVLSAVPLGNPDAVIAVIADLTTTFGDAHKDAAIQRATMIRNARIVEHGVPAKKDAPAVKGKGRQALIDAIQSAQALRELRKSLAAAKPSAAQQSDKAKAAKAKQSDAAKAAKAASPVKLTKPADTFGAAITLLRQCENFLSAGTHAQLIGRIEELVREFEPMRKAA